MTKAREPFLPLFFGDFLSATAEWEGEEQALYMLLLGYQWSKGSIPADPRRICKLARWDWELFAQFWPQVEEKFPLMANAIPSDGERHQSANGGRRQNARLEQHREKVATLSKVNSDSGKLGAEARWGKKNGTPMANAIPSDGERHQSANGAPLCHPIHPNPTKEEQERARATVPRETNTPEVTRAGAVCVAMKAEGMIDVSPAHPVLLELLKAGAEVGEFVDAARRAVADGKRFAYALAIVRGQRADAARLATDAQSPRGKGPTAEEVERDSLRKLMDRRAQLRPSIADFRDPNPGETAEQYRLAQDAEWKARQPRDVRAVAEQLARAKAVA